MMKTNVTVVIPTYNRAKELRITLSSYVSTLVKEIIIVNNGSRDDTTDVITSFNDRYGIFREIRISEKVGASRAKMIGVLDASTEYVLIGEDDVFLSPDYIDSLHSQIKQFHCDIISGKIISLKINSERDVEKAIKSINNDVIGFPQDFKPFQVPEEILTLGSPVEVPYTHAVCLLKKSICAENLFDSWYAGNGFREETDFFLSARTRGAKIFFTPATSCYHLRGSLGQTGGQRKNRLVVEFWSIYNTWYMLKKHYAILADDLKLKNGPLFNTFLYFIHREYGYLLRAFKIKSKK